MIVAHIFLKFPNNKQPYNLKLIERLKRYGKIHVKVVSFQKENKDCDEVTMYLDHKKMNWINYIYNSFRFYSEFILYKREYKLTLKKAIFLFGRYSNLLKLEAHVLHVHHIQLLTKYFLGFLTMFDTPIILTIRGSDVLIRPNRSSEEHIFFKNVISKIKYFQPVSYHLGKEIERYGINPEAIFPIHRTVEVDEYFPYESGEKQNSKVVEITTIGRVHWTKGYIDAIKALAKLYQSNIDFHYNICGSYTDEQKDEVIFWSRKLGIRKKISFRGHIKPQELDKLLCSTDVYLQTSLSEGVPNSILRALFFKIPIVTTNAGGIPEVMNSKSGLVVDVGDVDAICLSLKEIIQNKLFRTEIALNPLVFGSELIEMEKYFEMYKSVCGFSE